MANALLNRLAWQFHHYWKGYVNVCVLNWQPVVVDGPSWETPLLTHYGRTFFMNALQYHSTDGVEIKAVPGESERVLQMQEEETHPQALDTNAQYYRFLSKFSRRVGEEGEVILSLAFSLDETPFLNDYRPGGEAGVSASMALELIASAAAILNPHAKVQEVCELNLLDYVPVEEGQGELEILTHSDFDENEIDDHLILSLRLLSASGAKLLYYATVKYSTETLESSDYQSTLQADGAVMTLNDVYGRLFHHGGFQAVRKVDIVGERGALVDVSVPNGIHWFSGDDQQGDYVFNPSIIDSALQLAFIWAHTHRQLTVMPKRIKRVRRFGDVELSDCQMHFLPYANDAEDEITADVAFVDRDQKLRLLIEGLVCASSAKTVPELIENTPQ